MNFRGSEIYVSAKTKRRLRWLAAAHGKSSEGKFMSADEFAEKLLNTVIEARYPMVKEAEKEYEAAEQRLAAALREVQQVADLQK